LEYIEDYNNLRCHKQKDWRCFGARSCAIKNKQGAKKIITTNNGLP
jgi:hypothetical protein